MSGSSGAQQENDIKFQEQGADAGESCPQEVTGSEKTEAKQEEKGRRRRGRLHWKSFLAGILAAAAGMSAAAGIWLLFPVSVSPEKPGSLGTMKKINEMVRIIQEHYYGDISNSDLTENMMSGLVSGLGDQYSAYYPEEEYSEIRLANKGYTRGIGISLAQKEDGSLYVVYVQADSPAAQAGLKENDVLTAINGQDLDGYSVSEAVALVQDAEDDKVTVRFTREGTEGEQTVSMEKSDIEIYSVAGGMLKEDSRVGYIQISKFNGTTSDQFKEIYDGLQEKGMKALILDLRDNPGGQVSGCCDVLEQILPKGVIVYEKDKDGSEQTRDCSGKSPIQIPLAVLVNENTASASEIFTGAVQDYGVGTVIGTQTYGKGIEQKSYTLSDGSVVKLTTTHYFTPKHRDINGVGITPDLVVENQKNTDTDEPFEKALGTVQSRIGDESSSGSQEKTGDA
ncbi:MAG TPA: hypothetical protein DCZ61_03140 [Lachnospiraceae bacterium]|nr:hypothetical protein [Lachnospiraceae bacterium]